MSIQVIDKVGIFTGLSGSTGATPTMLVGKAAYLGGWFLGNNNAAFSYMQIFDVATPVGIVLGTTQPTFSFPLPANAAANQLGKVVIRFNRGICFAFTTTRTGGSGPSSTVDWNLFFL